MENNIPSAEEFLRQFENERPILKAYTESNSDKNCFYSSAQGFITIMDVMIEFAKLHVKAALITAYKNADLKEEEAGDEQICWESNEMGDCFVLDKNSIVNAYPEDLIK